MPSFSSIVTSSRLPSCVRFWACPAQDFMLHGDAHRASVNGRTSDCASRCERFIIVVERRMAVHASMLSCERRACAVAASPSAHTLDDEFQLC